VKNNLMEPVMAAFFANGPRYNLLNSAVLELIELIIANNVKVGGVRLWGWRHRGYTRPASTGCKRHFAEDIIFELYLGGIAFPGM
jgi:hypothetical protein